jgi:hypothetical protein
MPDIERTSGSAQLTFRESLRGPPPGPVTVFTLLPLNPARMPPSICERHIGS